MATANKTPVLSVEHVTMRFGGLTAVSDLSFQANRNEITALIGPNGAGKTTTFRILYGLLRPDGGWAAVDGLDVSRARTAALRRLGVLPETRGLYPRLTAREHLRYFGQLQGLTGTTLEQRIDALVPRLGLEEIIDRRARGFSRGQELKVALGRALVHRPRTLILDEPTNGLDVPANRAVRQILKAMRAEGHCIVISSHVMAEVALLCDRLVIIERGRAVVTGTLAELRARFTKFRICTSRTTLTGNARKYIRKCCTEPASSEAAIKKTTLTMQRTRIGTMVRTTNDRIRNIPPISASRPKAIQWSTAWSGSAKAIPRVQPISAIAS